MANTKTKADLDLEKALKKLQEENAKLKKENAELKDFEDFDEAEQGEIDKYMQERVEVNLFKDNGKYKNDVVVGLNGKLYQIQRGKPVSVPRAVAMIIESSERQKRATDELIAQKEQEFLDKKY